MLTLLLYHNIMSELKQINAVPKTGQEPISNIIRGYRKMRQH